MVIRLNICNDKKEDPRTKKSYLNLFVLILLFCLRRLNLVDTKTKYSMFIALTP